MRKLDSQTVQAPWNLDKQVLQFMAKSSDNLWPSMTARVYDKSRNRSRHVAHNQPIQKSEPVICHDLNVCPLVHASNYCI